MGREPRCSPLGRRRRREQMELPVNLEISCLNSSSERLASIYYFSLLITRVSFPLFALLSSGKGMFLSCPVGFFVLRNSLSRKLVCLLFIHNQFGLFCYRKWAFVILLIPSNNARQIERRTKSKRNSKHFLLYRLIVFK